MNEDRMRELFREMREDAVPADSLVRVRMRVTERTRRSRTLWRFAALIAAAACLVVAVFLAQQPASVAPPVVALAPRPIEGWSARTSSLLAGREPALQERHVPAPRPSRQDVLIRIETPDPDVVLFFVADGSAD